MNNWLHSPLPPKLLQAPEFLRAPTTTWSSLIAFSMPLNFKTLPLITAYSLIALLNFLISKVAFSIFVLLKIANGRPAPAETLFI
jgi:hypothetical protein